jgi:hypothetical protein
MDIPFSLSENNRIKGIIPPPAGDFQPFGKKVRKILVSEDFGQYNIIR